MTAGSSERRTVKLRRRGRHAAPSQVEKVAAHAGKAAPAVAIAGALVAVPSAQSALAATVPAAQTASAGHAATASPASGTSHVTAAVRRSATLDSYTASKTAKSAAKRMYTVHGGDSLSLIAKRFYHKADDWQWLYHVNDTKIADPNVIFVGQRIAVPLDPPASYTLPHYQPRHAAPTSVTASGSQSHVTATRGGSTSSRPVASRPTSSRPSRTSSGSGTSVDNKSSSTSSTYIPPSGQYSCASLENLWEQAGGNSADAFTAAEIAMAESGGNPGAISPTDDYGLWQINASNGSLATLDPYQNAKSAIVLSDDGTNWDAWTTFTSGDYRGRC
jgi:LysM repeat protein